MEYISIEAKHVLGRSKVSSHFQCGYYISPYRGCEYGCTYCPGHFPGDSHDKVWVNTNAPLLLKKELKNSRKDIVCILGYQPAEKIYRVIQKLLKVTHTKHFPVHIITRSDIVLDDMEILAKISSESWCSVSFFIPTMDNKIANIFEPNAPTPLERMEALDKVKQAGISAGVIISPVIPFITDSETQMKKIIDEAVKRKADYVIYEILKLKDDYRQMMVQTIKKHYPKLLMKYKQLYELGPDADIRYTRKTKRKINKLLDDQQIPNSLPQYDEGIERKQVNLEKFFKK
jgi:DNA repair photolyase